MTDILKKRTLAKRRRNRVRAKVSGTKEQPRLVVFRSLRHINVQLINDDVQKTLFSASDKELADTDKKGKKPVEVAQAVGILIGKKAVEGGIKKAVFDRRSYKYHGRVKALAEGARQAGLEF